MPKHAIDNRYRPEIIALLKSRKLIDLIRTGDIEAVNEYFDGVYAVKSL